MKSASVGAEQHDKIACSSSIRMAISSVDVLMVLPFVPQRNLVTCAKFLLLLPSLLHGSASIAVWEGDSSGKEKGKAKRTEPREAGFRMRMRAFHGTAVHTRT